MSFRLFPITKTWFPNSTWRSVQITELLTLQCFSRWGPDVALIYFGRKWVFMIVVTQLYLGKSPRLSQTWCMSHVTLYDFLCYFSCFQPDDGPLNEGPTHLVVFRDFPKFSCVTSVINTHFLPASNHTRVMTPLKTHLLYFHVQHTSTAHSAKLILKHRKGVALRFLVQLL
jgi:hypothetical protein